MTLTEKKIRDLCSHYADWYPSVSQIRELIALAQTENLSCKSTQARLATAWGYTKSKQEPIAYFNPQVKGGFYWAKPTKITAPTTVSVEPIPLYTTPPQRKPLTYEQRFALLAKFEAHKHEWHAPAILIDMVESAHGITKE